MQPSWHEEATDEFCLSAVYYERKTEGLGERFIREKIKGGKKLLLYGPFTVRLGESLYKTHVYR